MQFLAGFQVEPIDRPRDDARRARAQRFHESPQGFFPMRRLHQDRAAWIEAEAIEAMPGYTSGQMSASAPSISRHDEEDRFSAPLWRREECRRRRRGPARQNRHEKTESRRQRSLCCRDDLMQSAASEAAFRQVRIQGVKSEGQRLLVPIVVQAVRPRQQPAQFGHDGRPIEDREAGWECCRNNHLRDFRTLRQAYGPF
jgi:hypothetical protein